MLQYMAISVHSLSPDAGFFVICSFSKELREPMLKAYELRSECDKLEKLCKFLQERLDEASAYYLFLIHI